MGISGFRLAAPLGLLFATAALAEGQQRDTLVLPEVRVVGAADHVRLTPGSVSLVDSLTLRYWRSFTINETLRRVPGIVAREEEGFGLRPNIGVRGLNPTRSTKVLLLEDGIPVTFAPYGDNASYYHPPLERFDRIEVLKGSGQIMFGPQTVGGVINYVTPRVPSASGGAVTVGAGSRGFLNISTRLSVSGGPAGGLFELLRRTGRGARENTGSRIEDGFLKLQLSLGPRHGLALRANAYRERSNVTYSGLTESEWAVNPRANPFVNDSMLLDRRALSLTHRLAAGGGTTFTTAAYISTLSRDWWRQSSNSDQRPSDSTDPACGGMRNLTTTCGNQGRLRDYTQFGLEPRVRSVASLAGVPLVLDAGVRVHLERQRRRQVNSDTPTGRIVGTVAEHNDRDNTALAAFVQPRLGLGAWAVTPGVRLEHVRYERINRLVTPEVHGRTSLTQLVPGLGLTFNPAERISLFAGVHRGFAPPRTEDLIDNSGGVVELDAELSWNWEAGVRIHADRVSVEGTVFRMDFENQIVPSSVAGGSGATLTNAGATRHAGVELAARWDLGHPDAAHGGYVQGTLTWLPVADFAGERYVFVGTGGPEAGRIFLSQNAVGTRRQVDVTGNRLPYAPAATLTAAAGYRYRRALDARFEVVRLGRQFADPLNSAANIPNGQQGELPAYTVWNAAVTWTLLGRTAVFLSVQNVFDALYIADRTRGLLPGLPRTLELGISQGLSHWARSRGPAG